MRKTANVDYIKRYLLCIPLLNWALFALSVSPAIVLVWLDGGDAQLILSAGAAYAALALSLKTMIVWMLPNRLHNALIAVPKNIWLNALLVVLFTFVATLFAMPLFEFYPR